MRPRETHYINNTDNGEGEAYVGIAGDKTALDTGVGGRHTWEERRVIHLNDRKPEKILPRAPDEHFKLANCTSGGGRAAEIEP